MLLLCIFTGLEPSFYLAALVTPAPLVNHACKLLTCSMFQISGMPCIGSFDFSSVYYPERVCYGAFPFVSGVKIQYLFHIYTIYIVKQC